MKPWAKKTLRISVIVVATPLISFALIIGYIIFFEGYNISFSKHHKEKKEIAKWSKIIEEEPENYKAYVHRGELYQRIGKIKKMMQDYDKAIEIDPEKVDAYYYRSFYYYMKSISFIDHHGFHSTSEERKRALIRAIKEINKAISLEPESGSFYGFRANLLSNNKKYEAALVDLNKAMEIDSSYFKLDQFYDFRGWLYFELKQYDKALVDYSKSYKIEPSSYNHSGKAEAYYGLAKAFEDEGRIPEALQAYNGFLEHEKDNAWAEAHSYEIEDVREKIKALEENL